MHPFYPTSGEITTTSNMQETRMTVAGSKFAVQYLQTLLIQETQRRQYEGHNTPLGLLGVYCGLNTASVVFLIFYYPTIPIYLVCFFLFAPFSDVFLPKYSQTAILHAAHFQWVVN